MQVSRSLRPELGSAYKHDSVNFLKITTNILKDNNDPDYSLDQDAETSFSLMNENKKALPKQCFQLTRQDSQGIASKRFISCRLRTRRASL